ncbi:DUF4244 domain-containing protein [Isoptericola aurantiacus]|uniref:DUF4244 domain-containing protein n=1 Tax=Isoptericola aurantiacus TaxID=3377839 RepID=UPI00383ACC6E
MNDDQGREVCEEPTGAAQTEVSAQTVDRDPEAGMATAEYAIATIAAVGFAGLLILVLQSDTVRGMLESIIGSALSV